MGEASFTTGRGPVLVGVVWAWAGVATILYLLRAINSSRAADSQRSLFGLRWDFVWVTIAYVTAVCANVFMTVSVTYGTGNHQTSLTDHQAVFAALWSWIGQICAIFALVWGRFAVICFLVALQGPTYPHWRWALYIVGGAQALINTIEVVLILNQCSPPQKLWNFSLEGTCDLIVITSKVGFLQGSIGAFADFFLALYPPAVIIGPLQQMRLIIKVGLCLIMGGGVVAGIAGIVKTIQIEGITHTEDISYATLDLLIWVLTEVWFIIIFGTLPVIRSVLKTGVDHVISLTHPSTHHTTKTSSNPRSHNNWYELSAGGDKASYADAEEYKGEGQYSVMTSINHGDGRGLGEYESSQEEILGVGRGDIVITKELRVSTNSQEGGEGVGGREGFV